MKTNLCRVALPLLICMLSALAATSQNTPRWVNKGVEELQKERTNDTYDFVMFHTHGQDIAKIEIDAVMQLKKYVVDKFGAKPDSVRIDYVNNTVADRYVILFPNAESNSNRVVAQLIDTYSKFEDYELNYFEYEYYQLYAVSQLNVIPEFDNFKLTTKYNSKAVALSLVPGLGQLYKGQNTKAYVMMGAEAFFIGGALLFNYKSQDAKKMRTKDPLFAQSWRSKQRGYRTFCILSVCGAAGTYIYNLFDAALSQGARQVVVSKPKSYNLSVAPYAAPDIDGMAMGVSMRLQF